MKWVYRILAVVLGTLLVSALTVLTTGFVVNTYVQSLLASMNIKWEGQPSGLTSLIRTGMGGSAEKTFASGQGSGSADLSASDNDQPDSSADIAGTDVTANTQPLPFGDSEYENQGANNQTAGGGAEGEADGQHEPALQDNGTGTGKADGSAAGSSGGDPAPEDALPVMGGTTDAGSSSGAGVGSGGSDQTVISPDELQAHKDDIPSSEKEEVFSMLMNKLPEEEMQKISAAMEGGLTEKELIDVQQILSKYLSKDDYAKMLSILDK